MWMSEEEIVAKYKRNGKDSNQIKILAELNGVTSKDIINIIAKHDELSTTPPKVRKPVQPRIDLTKEEEDNIINLRKNGATLNEIHEEVKYSIAVIRRVLKSAECDPVTTVKEIKEVKETDIETNDISSSETLLEATSEKVDTIDQVLVKLDDRIEKAEESLDFLKASRKLIVEIVDEINCQKKIS